ncbi:MAG: DPP IV N-terminal domain-containing protein, partial [Gemmatimonadales bacterium]
MLFVICLIAAPAAAAAAQRPSSFDFSIKNIMRGPELYGRAPGSVRWSGDSRWIYFMWAEPGTDWREQPRWFRVRPVAGARPEKISPAQFDSVGAYVTAGTRSGNGRYIAVEYDGDIYVTDTRTGTTRRLTQTLAREHDPTFAVDGSRVFFVRDNNVYSMDLTGGLIRQLTDLRQGPEAVDSARAAGQRGRLEQQQKDLFDAIRDRVRADSIQKATEKERESRGLKTYYTQRGENIASLSVAPTGGALLVTTRIPTQNARTADLMRIVTESGYPEVIRGRTNVGDVQSRGRIGFLTLPSGAIKWLTPFPTDTANGRVQVLGWNDNGTRAAFYAYTADNKLRLLQSVDAATGRLTTLETLRDSAWVDGPCADCGGWYDQGRRLWYVSEASGFAHLYTVAADGSNRRQLTSGKWEVRSAELSPDGKWFYLHTSEVSPFERQIYRMSVNGGARERLTTKSGGHTGVVSPDGEWIADVYSYVNRPPDLFLMRNKAGADEAQLTTSPSAEWLSFPWLAPEIVMIPGSDGVGVPAHIYRPKDMNAQPNGAAVVFVHGAGYLHNVGNFWSEYPREYMFN